MAHDSISSDEFEREIMAIRREMEKRFEMHTPVTRIPQEVPEELAELREKVALLERMAVTTNIVMRRMEVTVEHLACGE